MGPTEVALHRILLFRSERKLGPSTVPVLLRLFFGNLSHGWVPRHEHWMLHLVHLMPPPTPSPRSGLSGWTCFVRLPDLLYETEGCLFHLQFFYINGDTIVHPCLMRNCLTLWRRRKGRKRQCLPRWRPLVSREACVAGLQAGETPWLPQLLTYGLRQSDLLGKWSPGHYTWGWWECGIVLCCSEMQDPDYVVSVITWVMWVVLVKSFFQSNLWNRNETPPVLHPPDQFCWKSELVANM